MRRPSRWLLGLLLVVTLLVVIPVVLLLVLVDPVSRAAHLPQRVDVSPLSRYITVPFVGTDGITLHYLDAGSDTDGSGEALPVFLLLHGFTFNAFTWQAQMQQLARHGRVIALDQLPYGLSDKPVPGEWDRASPYSREAAVMLVRSLLDQLELRRVIIVGNSSGGTLGAEVALAEPERIDGLVDTAPLRRISLLAARELGLRMPLLESSFAEPARMPIGRRELAGLHTQTRNWDLAWAALLDQSLRTRIDLAERIGDLVQPVLVLSGDHDRLVPVDDSRRLA
ncbi:MAG: alpha/beta hydrolase, partial [Chromatiaceae bacterium]